MFFFLLYVASSSILSFRYFLVLFLKCLLVSRRILFRLFAFTSLVFSNHCNLACFLWSNNFGHPPSNHGRPGPSLLLNVRNKHIFYGDELLAPCRIPKPEDHPLSAVIDCLFNIFAAALHVESVIVILIMAILQNGKGLCNKLLKDLNRRKVLFWG
jgi:hypothetical protein